MVILVPALLVDEELIPGGLELSLPSLIVVRIFETRHSGRLRSR